MGALRKAASFIKWRLIPVRHLMGIQGLHKAVPRLRPIIRTRTAEALEESGYIPGPQIEAVTLEELNRKYRPRTEGLAARTVGHPFIELFTPADLTADDPAVRLAFSAPVLDVAADYFGGELILDSIQMLYTFSSSEGPLRESQKWHLDFGDKRTIHFIAYLNDVMKPEDGPFGFVEKQVSRKVRSFGIVRRIDDDVMRRETANAEPREIYGPAGTSMFVDPAACYHYGSRGRNPRLALFVTFNSRRPFIQPVKTVVENKARIFETARQLRPDLSDEFLCGLLQLRRG
jgi:hypothetical protein